MKPARVSLIFISIFTSHPLRPGVAAARPSPSVAADDVGRHRGFAGINVVALLASSRPHLLRHPELPAQRQSPSWSRSVSVSLRSFRSPS